MENLHWQLSVLSKSIHYKNLSGAAAHVGLSQPQLSRIISRLEQELGVVLLDRAARRKSGWTPVAYKIAETYFQSSRKLTQNLQKLTTESHITQVSIGILEGLIPLATRFCQQLIEHPNLQLVELNVYDLTELEERFEKNELDLVFTCREPGKHKYKFVRNLGYQVIEKVGREDGLRVFSQFEYANHIHKHSRRASVREGTVPKKSAEKAPKKTQKGQQRIVLSNSLVVRRHWIDEGQGSGYVPSEVRQRKTGESDVPVILIASELLNPSLWQKFEQFRL